jgi:hypothetical protein
MAPFSTFVILSAAKNPYRSCAGLPKIGVLRLLATLVAQDDKNQLSVLIGQWSETADPSAALGMTK